MARSTLTIFVSEEDGAKKSLAEIELGLLGSSTYKEVVEIDPVLAEEGIIATSPNPFACLMRMLDSGVNGLIKVETLKATLGSGFSRPVFQRLFTLVNEYDVSKDAKQRLKWLVEIHLLACRFNLSEIIGPIYYKELETAELQAVALDSSIDEWPYLVAFRGYTNLEEMDGIISRQEIDYDTHMGHVTAIVERSGGFLKKYKLQDDGQDASVYTQFKVELKRLTTHLQEIEAKKHSGIWSPFAYQMFAAVGHFTCAVKLINLCLLLYEHISPKHLSIVWELLQSVSEWAAYAEAIRKIPQTKHAQGSRQSIVKRKDSRDFTLVVTALEESAVFQGRLQLFSNLYDLQRLFKYRSEYDGDEARWFGVLCYKVRSLLTNYCQAERLGDSYDVMMVRLLFELRRDLLHVTERCRDSAMKGFKPVAGSALELLTDISLLKKLKQEIDKQVEMHLGSRCFVEAISSYLVALQKKEDIAEEVMAAVTHYNLLKELMITVNACMPVDSQQEHVGGVEGGNPQAEEAIAVLQHKKIKAPTSGWPSISDFFTDSGYATYMLNKIKRMREGKYDESGTAVQDSITINRAPITMRLLGGVDVVAFKVDQGDRSMVLRLYRQPPDPINEEVVAGCREQFPDLFDEVYHKSGAIGEHYEACQLSTYFSGGSFEGYMNKVHKQRGQHDKFTQHQKRLILNFFLTHVRLLKYLHKNDYYYPDIKESNVLFDRDSRAYDQSDDKAAMPKIKISDTKSFGALRVARVSSGPVDRGDTDEGVDVQSQEVSKVANTIMYTPDYAAPEVVAAMGFDGNPIDPRSGDYHALGIALLRCITGKKELDGMLAYKPRDEFERVLLQICRGYTAESGQEVEFRGLISADPHKRWMFANTCLTGRRLVSLEERLMNPTSATLLNFGAIFVRAERFGSCLGNVVSKLPLPANPVL
jgi:serine/threonine protein kinase